MSSVQKKQQDKAFFILRFKPSHAIMPIELIYKGCAMEQQETRLTWATKINYGIGTTGKSLSNGLSSRLQYYLLTVLHMNRGLQGPLLVIGRIWDGLNDLIMGMVVDNTRTKWGKFRPWIAIGALTNSLVMVGLFGGPAALRENQAALFGYITVLWLLWDMTYTMVDVAYWSMIPALSSSPKERDQISTIPRIFAGVFAVATAFNIQIIDFLGKGDEFTGFRRFAIITSIIYVITSLYSAAFVREPKLALPRHLGMPNEKKETIGLGKAVSILVHNKQALVVTAVMILFNLAANMTNGVAIYYFRFVVENDTQFSFFNILTGLSSGIGMFGFPFLTKRFDRKKVYALAFALPCIGCAGMALANLALRGQFLPLIAAAFAGHIGYGLMGVMQNVMLADSVDYGEFETGIRNEGIIFCTLTMLSKLAGALNDMVSLATFSAVRFGGQDAVTATPAAVKGIACLMYVFPPIALAISFALYKALYKLSPGRMEEIHGALEERRQRAAQEE